MAACVPGGNPFHVPNTTGWLEILRAQIQLWTMKALGRPAPRPTDLGTAPLGLSQVSPPSPGFRSMTYVATCQQ